ncbi:MAG: hypothetical protein ABSC05_17375 [Candidatus Solibacter sp.]
MWTIPRAAVPHRLVDDFVGFLSGNRLAFHVHFRKILPKRLDDLVASLIGYGRRLESLNAHSLLLRYGPAEQAFDCHLLVSREVFHVTDHMLPTNAFQLHYDGFAVRFGHPDCQAVDDISVRPASQGLAASAPLRKALCFEADLPAPISVDGVSQ